MRLKINYINWNKLIELWLLIENLDCFWNHLWKYPNPYNTIYKLILLKGQFEREKIIFYEKNLKHKKIILLINFIFAQTYFLIASSQIFENDAILIMVHFFKKKILYNLTASYFWNWINYYQIQQFVYKNFVLKNCFFIITAIKEFIFKNRKPSSCRESFS